jgi:hypothetical protein
MAGSAMRVEDFALTLREEGEGGMHIEMISRSRGRVASFPFWDHADRDLRHFTMEDVPLGTEAEPYVDVDENWRIEIFTRGEDAVVIEDGREFTVPLDQYLAAWDTLMRRFNPVTSLEDALGDKADAAQPSDA